MDNKINFSIREKVNAWHVQNPDVYKKFIRNFEKMSSTNIDFATKIVKLIADNIPDEFEELWQFIINSDENASCSLLETYGGMFDRCLSEGKCFSVIIASGEVKEYDNVKNLLLQQGEVLFSKQIFDSIFDKLPRKAKGIFGYETEGSNSGDMKDGVFAIFSAALIAVPGLIQNLISKRKQNYNLAYSLSYFMIFDHGLLKMQKKLSSLMIAQNWDFQSQMMGDMLIRGLVDSSVSYGYNTKLEWTEQSKEEDEETAETINATLAKVKGSGGRHADFGSIEELCIGDKDKLMQLICKFLDEETETVSLAYLFYAMKMTGHISIKDYKAFHRAIKLALPDRAIKGLNKPQERYAELQGNSIALDAKKALEFKEYRTYKWKKARKIVNRWLPLFAQVS